LRFLVIGNPENRRVAFFQQALAQAGLPQARVLAYEDLLAGRCALADELRPGTFIRIESPGENFAVQKLLLARGAARAAAEGSPALSPRQIDALEFDRGRILHPRQWFLGFESALAEWQSQLPEGGGVRFMNSPRDIAVMFDKVACHARFSQARIPVPASPRHIASFDELVARMDESGNARVFVKLAHGSSASGVVALHRLGPIFAAVTSAELVRSAGELRLYNSLKIRRYTALEDIRDLIDALARERVQVEEWLPKAALDADEPLDLRIVLIAGRPCHLVVRQGRSPMTNLHLGNRRGDTALLVARLGDERLQALHATCRQAAALFPESLYSGLDLLLTPGFRRHAVLEINAFGDLLPGIVHEGLDTYGAEVAQIRSPGT
jgi:glutathione synthase/RimK-type ligase-like ATP-grasp enzyme